MWKQIEVELYGTRYQRIGNDWYEATTFVLAPQRLARQLDERLHLTGISVPRFSLPVQGEQRRGNGSNGFR